MLVASRTHPSHLIAHLIADREHLMTTASCRGPRRNGTPPHAAASQQQQQPQQPPHFIILPLNKWRKRRGVVALTMLLLTAHMYTLYFSTYALTSIGFGDIVAVNRTEARVTNH